MRRSIALAGIGVALLLVSSCAAPPDQPTPTAEPTATVQPTQAPPATAIPSPTAQPTVAPTQVPTATLAPTATLVPTARPTLVPATSTAVPSPTSVPPTATLVPRATATTVPPTATAEPTRTLQPTATRVPATNTPQPSSTPVPTARPTSAPAPTAQPAAQATPDPSPTDRVVQLLEQILTLLRQSPQAVTPTPEATATPMTTQTSASAGGCRVINDYGLALKPEVATSGTHIHVEYWWEGQPERETLLPTTGIPGGRFILNRALNGHVWEYSGCQDAEVMAQINAHIPRRIAGRANNAGFVEWASTGLFRPAVQ